MSSLKLDASSMSTDKLPAPSVLIHPGDVTPNTPSSPESDRMAAAVKKSEILRVDRTELRKILLLLSWTARYLYLGVIQ